MKKIILILSLLISIASQAQVPTPDYSWRNFFGKINFKPGSQLAIPRDSIVASDTNSIWFTDHKLWINDNGVAKVVGASDSGANNYTTGVTFSTGSGELQMTRYGLSAISTNLDGRYLLLSDSSKFVKYTDTADMLANYLHVGEVPTIYDDPLELYTAGDSVLKLRVKWWVPTWNANALNSVALSATKPSADGDILTYNAGMDYAEWKPMTGVVAMAVNRYMDKNGSVMFAKYSGENSKIMEALRRLYDMIQNQQVEIDKLKQ